ncbi:MAG: hypothetical protein M1608_06950 [Candidatus Omnitrophica bacterium]|nr:hypothetical protein [Candidatus Omnitrophota bacterium]
MDNLLYCLARFLIATVQSLPLTWGARLGRLGGIVFYYLDARHRKVALRNLNRCFGREKKPGEIRALARENFRRIGENYVCAVKTASMKGPALRRRVEILGAEKILRTRQVPSTPIGQSCQSCIVAIGHFGNFELYAHAGQLMLGFQTLTTYRALRQPALNRLMQSMRVQTGCQFFERRTEAGLLRAALKPKGVMLGLLVDQHAGDRGLAIEFFGEECSTSAAPAIFSLRYGLPLYTAVCFRTRLGHWRIEVGDEIPTRHNGQARSTRAIMEEINRAFETATRRDPANWFWVHQRWKPVSRRRQSARLAPGPDNAAAGPDCNKEPINLGNNPG